MIDTGEMTPLVHVSGMFGNARANTAWIAPIAWHPTNQIRCYVAIYRAMLAHY
ncbi:exonuclease I [Actinobacillus equuli]|nr:exonuclease I [Actinobacillus equuli]